MAAQRVRLVLPASEVKNHRDLEHPLPPWVVALLDLYLARARPVLQPRPGPWLFPGARDGEPKTAQALRQQVKDATEEELGLRLTPHQFRHACGLVYLTANPGGHEVVRHLLGHRSIATTIRYYAGMETAAALRHYDAVVLERRQEAEAAAARRQGPAPWLSPCPARRASTRRAGRCRWPTGLRPTGRPGRRRPRRATCSSRAGRRRAGGRPRGATWPRAGGTSSPGWRAPASSMPARTRASGSRPRGWRATSRPCARAATRPATVHVRVEALGLFLGAVAPGADQEPVRRLLGRLRPGEAEAPDAPRQARPAAGQPRPAGAGLPADGRGRGRGAVARGGGRWPTATG